MLTSNGANTLVSNQLDDVLRHLGHARAGSEDAIHQARIGIRRLFEELPLAVNRFDEDELEAVRRRLSGAARALSRVRDADIGQRLVDSMAARFLTSSTMLGRLRDVMMEHREKARRKAIKTLEAIDLASLSERVARARRHRLARFGSHGKWRSAFQSHLASRAADVRVALERTGSVYFPNRLHTARIAIKRLRYAFELADRTENWRPSPGLGLLKRAQEALGQAHDREVLLKRLDELRKAEVDTDPNTLEPIEHYLRAEVREFHETYVRSQPAILDLCDACSKAPSSAKRRIGTMLAAGVVLPSLLLIGRRSADAAPRRKARTQMRTAATKTA